MTSVTGSNANNPYTLFQSLWPQSSSASGTQGQTDPLSSLLAALGQQNPAQEFVVRNFVQRRYYRCNQHQRPIRSADAASLAGATVIQFQSADAGRAVCQRGE